MPKPNTTLRVARATNNLEAVKHFYGVGLGLEQIADFADHEGFDGVMFGIRGAAYHLEFTHHHGHVVANAPTQDNLLVFYFPDLLEWQTAVQQMQAAGYKAVKSYNPYWDVRGKTFEDPDGYRVVLQNSAWSL
jgi:catechol 2,3-dioxygenase-like lactoylglutathione lyase family enzyme